MASVLEETISAESKYVGFACSGFAEALSLMRFLTAHLLDGLIFHLVQTPNQMVTQELSPEKAMRVQTVRCSLSKPTFRPRVLDHLIITDFSGNLVDGLSVKEVLEQVSVSAIFATTEEMYYQRFADSVLDLEPEKEGVIGLGWILIRIKQIPIWG
jgi:hypothetical protein